MAARLFLKNKIAYLVVADEDYGKDDFLKNRRLWGISDLGEAGHAHLYRFGNPPEPPSL